MDQHSRSADFLAFVEQQRSVLVDRIAADCIAQLEQISIMALRNSEGALDGTMAVARDMREEHALEIERARMHEDMIRMQELALRELSTPLLAVSDQAVVMPLIGAIDSRRAQQAIEMLLEGITTYGASIAILDITGVSVVDTQVANALLRAAQAVRLLGAQVVLTGIRPEIAQTLVGLGADLSEVVTRSSLQSGIAYAIGNNDRGFHSTWERDD